MGFKGFVNYIHSSIPNPFEKVGGLITSSVVEEDAKNKPPASPLWRAIYGRSVPGLKRAIAQGADVNERNHEGLTPLLYVAKAGQYKYPPHEIPQLLIQAGAMVNAMDLTGYNALQISLIGGWPRTAALLLQSGAQKQSAATVREQITNPECNTVMAKFGV